LFSQRVRRRETKNGKMRPIIILLCVVIFHCSVQNVGAAAARSNRIWPISGNTSVDLPQSSPFSPRLQISQGSKYDYHRGIDIPADLYSKVYAVSDGTVRINGSHHGYSDGVVQLHHTDWEEGGDFYTNYIHIVMSDGQNPISLTNGQSVGKGQHIAYSNGTPSLDHIHFEVRVGSYRKEYACNPWKYLPNSDNDYSSFEAELSLTPNYNSIDCQAVVNVSVPPNQLTFNRVELHILDSSDTPQKVRFYDMCGTNVNYTQGQVDNSTYQDDPDDYSSSYLIRISPMFFNSKSYDKNERAGWGFEFVDLPLLSGGGRVMAKIFDVFGNSHSNGYFNYTCSDGGNTSSTTATSSTTPTEESSCSGCTRNDRIWPISGTTTVDLPQSVPYGSRRYSSSGSYNFHRGVDIRCSTYTNVYAVADGTVRINGSHSGYSSSIVQLKHAGWEENPGGYVYTNYQQISLVKSGGEDPITLPLGHNVEKGDLIAYSYRESNFVYIHFEVRAGGTASKYSSNPWKYMPNGANDYTSFDTASVSLTTNYNDVECQAVVNVSVPPNLLTFNRVELHILDSSDTPQKVRFYDMHGTRHARN
jgi:murein DD-endopeptidase MepM/ murein hydrolase activator NlpD